MATKQRGTPLPSKTISGENASLSGVSGASPDTVALPNTVALNGSTPNAMVSSAGRNPETVALKGTVSAKSVINESGSPEKNRVVEAAGKQAQGYDPEIIAVIDSSDVSVAKAYAITRSGWFLKATREGTQRLFVLGDGGAARLSAAAFLSPQLLAIADSDSVRIFAIVNERPELRYSLEGRLRTRLTSLGFASASDSLLMGGADGSVYRWRYKDEAAAQSTQEHDRAFERYLGHSAAVSAVFQHPATRIFFSGDWQGALNAWIPYNADPYEGSYDVNLFGGRGYTDKATRQRASRANSESIGALTSGSSGRWLFMCLEGGSIEMWKVRGFAKVARGELAQGQCFDLLASDDDRQLAIATRDDLVRVINVSESAAVDAAGVTYSFTEQLRFSVAQPRVLAWGKQNTLWVGDAKGGVSYFALSSPQDKSQ